MAYDVVYLVNSAGNGHFLRFGAEDKNYDGVYEHLVRHLFGEVLLGVNFRYPISYIEFFEVVLQATSLSFRADFSAAGHMFPELSAVLEWNRDGSNRAKLISRRSYNSDLPDVWLDVPMHSLSLRDIQTTINAAFDVLVLKHNQRDI